ncbi:required for drug-induced death protein 1 [Lissotriton helveticus]
MRQKKGKRKAKYPRLRPGEDQLSFVPEEHPPGSGQTPQVEGGTAATSTPARSPTRTPGAKKEPGDGRKGKKKRSSKKVHLAPLPDKYEPLEEGGGERESKGEKKSRRKQKAKKYARNVGKALQAGCRFLLIGFQGMANAYTAPWGVPNVVVSSPR